VSAQSRTTTRRRPARAASRAPARARARARRRRKSLLWGTLALACVAIAAIIATGPVQRGIREITLPLRHEDVIRQQAHAKGLDPALIAAVIFQESKFEDRTSSAGALGLMQLLPGTAHFIARKTGGTQFTTADLSTPQVNIAYGSWYLRYLIDRYGGNETLAVAAYNAGEHNVDVWVRRAGGDHSFEPKHDIPFAETRGYVQSVLQHRKQYRTYYARELGIK
jgi:soluble lytic murein transglycosylase